MMKKTTKKKQRKKTKKQKQNKTRKATSFKYLQINCWQINQATSKCKIHFLDKICRS